MILSFLALLCLNLAGAQDLSDFIILNGQKRKIHHEKIFKTEHGINYAKVDDQFYPVQQEEPMVQGPSYYTFFVIKENGEKFDISQDHLAHIRAQQEAKGVKTLKFKEYPKSKPFVRDTAKSGKAYKWFDVIRTKEGRIVSRDEFNSYRGNYTFVKIIDGGDFAMDTTIIIPPTQAALKAETDRKVAFDAQVGQPMKSFKTSSLFGEEIVSSQLKGKVIVINFWFIACPPCQKEIPDLNLLVEEYKNRNDIVFLGFATDTEKRLGTFLAESQFKYKIIPQSMSIAEDFLVGAYPTNFVIDKNGIVTYAQTGLGEDTISEIQEAIKKALN